MLSPIKKYPTFFLSAVIGVLASISASGLALLLSPGISASGAFEWNQWTAFGLSVAVLSVAGINYAVSLYLFYRDRAAAYALNFASAVMGLLILMKVASLFYF